MMRAACAVLALLLAAALPARAQALLAVPALSARVIDQTGTLKAGERDALEAKLTAFEAKAGPQIVVLLVQTTAPEDIAAFAQRVGDAWKLGRKDVGDGLLLVVALDDRRVHIATAKALEGAVPDLAARQVIDQTLRPAFRANDYAGGIERAIDALIARISGDVPPPSSRRAGDPGMEWHELAVLFFIAIPVIGGIATSVFGRKLGSVATGVGSGAMAWILTASLALAGVAGVIALILVGVMGIGGGSGRRGGNSPVIWGGDGGGGWGGGGGGFSSGGGGDFGGGGASGGW